MCTMGGAECGLVRGVGKYQWQAMPRELMGKSIGIVGLGALGKAIANLALAFGDTMGYPLLVPSSPP
jgi:phosphoglycerate dehydrogenase-like enzyme